MKEFDRQLHERVRRAEKVLTTYLPKEEEASFCLNVVQAMNYSLPLNCFMEKIGISCIHSWLPLR